MTWQLLADITACLFVAGLLRGRVLPSRGLSDEDVLDRNENLRRVPPKE